MKSKKHAIVLLFALFLTLFSSNALAASPPAVFNRLHFNGQFFTNQPIRV